MDDKCFFAIQLDLNDRKEGLNLEHPEEVTLNHCPMRRNWLDGSELPKFSLHIIGVASLSCELKL